MRIRLSTVVTLLIIAAFLAALIFPAVQAAREAKRRMQCASNVKQLALGVQNYCDTFLMMPYGARSRFATKDSEPTWGNSWLFSTIIFDEGGNRWWEPTLMAQEAAAENDYISAPVLSRTDGRRLKLAYCPSSPLPLMQMLNGTAQSVPSYAAIMGASNDLGIGNGIVDSERVARGPYDGWAAASGMLLINECVTREACTLGDGEANTLLLGEVSDWYYTDTGVKRNPALSVADAGDGPQPGAGWMAGTNLDLPKGKQGESSDAFFIRKGMPAIGAHRVCNVIAIRHPIGTSNRYGPKDTAPNWGTAGIGRCGFNNPLLSAHPAGAMVAYVDGHVFILPKETAVEILQKLACRDDGIYVDTGVD